MVWCARCLRDLIDLDLEEVTFHFSHYMINNIQEIKLLICETMRIVMMLVSLVLSGLLLGVNSSSTCLSSYTYANLVDYMVVCCNKYLYSSAAQTCSCPAGQYIEDCQTCGNYTLGTFSWTTPGYASWYTECPSGKIMANKSNRQYFCEDCPPGRYGRVSFLFLFVCHHGRGLT